MDDSSEEAVGGRFWLVVTGLVIGGMIAAFILFILFGWVWYSWGFLGALLCLVAVLLAFGWITDRRERNRRRELAA